MMRMFFLALGFPITRAEIVFVGEITKDINRIALALHSHPSPYIERP
jgi:hypothetical protein